MNAFGDDHFCLSSHVSQLEKCASDFMQFYVDIMPSEATPSLCYMISFSQ
jgi:hypothetical protein